MADPAGSSAYTDVNTLLEAHARRHPDKVFVESPDQRARITFGEFETLTRRLANFLASADVKHGDRVSILSENSIEALVVFWGALRAGVIVNPVNVEIRAQHVTHILEAVAPKLVFWSGALPVSPEARWIRLDELHERLGGASDAAIGARPARTDWSLIDRKSVV